MTTLPQDTSPADGPAETPLAFQFGMRAMLIGVGLLCAMFAVMAVAGAVRSLIVLWFLALIAAHVTANAWGARNLRRRGRAIELQSPLASTRIAGQLSDLARCKSVGPKRLGQVTSVSLSVIVCSALGGVVAGVVATLLLATATLGDVSYAGVAVGGVSAAAVGAFVGFLSSGFIHMAARAWREASACD